MGITKFCVHPDHWFRSKTRIGGTKNITVDKIRSLSPSIVIASKEENIKEQVDAITSFAEVLLTDIKNLDDALT
ncbi:helical backbone metal receptor, partial [Staphylococcus aureus]